MFLEKVYEVFEVSSPLVWHHGATSPNHMRLLSNIKLKQYRPLSVGVSWQAAIIPDHSQREVVDDMGYGRRTIMEGRLR